MNFCRTKIEFGMDKENHHENELSPCNSLLTPISKTPISSSSRTPTFKETFEQWGTTPDGSVRATPYSAFNTSSKEDHSFIEIVFGEMTSAKQRKDIYDQINEICRIKLSTPDNFHLNLVDSTPATLDSNTTDSETPDFHSTVDDNTPATERGCKNLRFDFSQNESNHITPKQDCVELANRDYTVKSLRDEILGVHFNVEKLEVGDENKRMKQEIDQHGAAIHTLTMANNGLKERLSCEKEENLGHKVMIDMLNSSVQMLSTKCEESENLVKTLRKKMQELASINDNLVKSLEMSDQSRINEMREFEMRNDAMMMKFDELVAANETNETRVNMITERLRNKYSEMKDFSIDCSIISEPQVDENFSIDNNISFNEVDDLIDVLFRLYDRRYMSMQYTIEEFFLQGLTG